MTISRGPVRPEGLTSDDVCGDARRGLSPRGERTARWVVLGAVSLLVASVADAQPSPQKPAIPKLAKPNPEGPNRPLPAKPAAPNAPPPKTPLPPLGGPGIKKKPPTKDVEELSARPKVSVEAPTRWTDETPDKMVALGINRARAGGPDSLAGLLIAASLEERATKDEVQKLVGSIGRGGLPLSDEARMLNLVMAPVPLGPMWEGWAKASFDAAPNRNGIVQAFAILGPFQDAGGGLSKHEGPEAQGSSFANAQADYSWGAYQVAWRRVLPLTVTAEGLPLDLYIAPRQETCTYLASKIIFAADVPGPVTAHLAATGAARLMWDGDTVASNEDMHTKAILDRMAMRVAPDEGAHLLSVKVCSGTQSDEGRVRVRFTDAEGKALAVQASSILDGIPADRLSTKAAPTGKRAPAKKPVRPEAPKASPAPKDDTAPKPQLKPGLNLQRLPMQRIPVPTPSGPNGVPSAPPVKKAGVGTSPPGKGDAPKAGAPKPGTPIAAKKPAVKNPKPERVLTMLEETLDVGPTPSVDASLRASVVRTLAGADDARSPRAPGLLDRVARDPAVTPDALALAGWLSGFGANRSGWMNEARERAKTAGDRATEAFAQRRIAQSQYTTGRLDWATTTMGEAPLKEATDVEARVMRVELASRIGGSGSQSKALDDLMLVDKAEKQRLPVFAVRDLRQLAGQRPDLALGLERRLAAMDRPGPNYPSTMGLEGAASQERAVAQVLIHQSNAEALASMGRQLLGLGRHAWAREVLYTATKLSPNSANAFEGLAAAREAVIHDEQTQGSAVTDDPRYAKAAAQRALDIRPPVPRARNEIAFRDGSFNAKDDGSGKTKGASKETDERYLVPAATILERAKAKPAKVGEVFDRQLHFMRVVTYHEDKRVSQLIHYAREIVVEPRTDDELFERDIPAEGDEAELVFARLYHKDGTVVQPEQQSSSGMPFVKWPELKRGDIVEVAVRGWTAGPVGRRGDAPFYFIDYVGSTETRPVLFNEVIVDSPEGSSLGVDVINGKADKLEESKVGGRKVQRFIWDNPPTVPEEPLAPRTSELLPIVVGSTYRSWDEFREWYKTAITGFSEPDEQIKDLAKKLTKDKKSEHDKLEAIFNFVADDIRYVNYVSSESWLPNRPQQLLARRQGDCDDKAMLLISLLKAINVDATPVLVQTRLTGMPSVLSSQTSAIPMFDHGIAFLPGKGGKPGTWLDATSPQSRLGPLPSMDARARALFVYQGDAKIIETPPSSPDDNGSAVEWTVKLGPTGAADIVAKEKHLGDWAFEMRNSLIEADARAPWLEQYLTSRWLSAVDLKGEVEYSAEAGTLGYTVHSEGFARREGEELSIPLAGTFSYTSSLAPLTKRTLPVWLPPNLAPSHQSRRITITAPEGYDFADLPPDGEVKGGSFGSAKATYKLGKDKRSVFVETSVVFDKSVIPVAEYPSFRTWLQNIDGLLRQQVRLNRNGTAVAPPSEVERQAPKAMKPTSPKPGDAPKPEAEKLPPNDVMKPPHKAGEKHKSAKP